APRSVSGLDLGVDRLHQGHGLRVAQTGRVRSAAATPGAIAAGAHGQHLAHFGQRVVGALCVDPGVLHSASFAKYAVAFFRMSTCIFSRAFSARSRDSSICSGVTGLAPGAVSLPAADALTQLRSVCSTRPSSLAATTMPTACACLTACSLNSAVYSCLGIFFTSLPSGLDANHRPLEDEERRAAQPSLKLKQAP